MNQTITMLCGSSIPPSQRILGCQLMRCLVVCLGFAMNLDLEQKSEIVQQRQRLLVIMRTMMNTLTTAQT